MIQVTSRVREVPVIHDYTAVDKWEDDHHYTRTSVCKCSANYQNGTIHIFSGFASGDSGFIKVGLEDIDGLIAILNAIKTDTEVKEYVKSGQQDPAGA